MKKMDKNTIDLTPLLDVVLILLFALLMTAAKKQEEVESKAEKLTEKVEILSETLVEYEDEIKKKTADIETLNEQKTKIDEAIRAWLTSEEIRDQEIISNEKLTELFDSEKTNQALYQLDFIANQFFFINIRFDTKNNQLIYINDESTGIQVSIDKRHEEKMLDEISNELYDIIEKVMDNKEGNYKFVLFTLEDNGQVYRFAYDLVWEVLKELERKDSDFTFYYKLQYLNYE